MTITTRKFSACPVRTAGQVWETITRMLAGNNLLVKQQLDSISGIAASIISDATPKSNPITLIGTGPRLRIYCLYEEDGSTEEANESPLNWNPFQSEWEIHIPVEKEDFEWVKKALSSKGPQFKAYEAGTKLNQESKNESKVAPLTINIEKLKSS